MDEHDKPIYQIGAVARLTGIPTHNLRMWERRYNVVEPQRTESLNRLYSKRDVARLSNIKELVDNGHAISTVATLSEHELEDRIQQLRPASRRVGDDDASRQIAIVSETLNSDVLGVDHVAYIFCRSINDLNKLHDAETKVDIVVLDMVTVHKDSINDVKKALNVSDASYALVVYRFGNAEAIEALNTNQTRALKGPVTATMLQRELILLNIMDINNDELISKAIPSNALSSMGKLVPQRMFDDKELQYYAGITTTVKCECPQHVTDLIQSLVAFERYSRECENRNEEDALLHAYLHSTTAEARCMMERALLRIVEIEGLHDARDIQAS